MIYNILIVDDEAAARARIRRLLADYTDIIITGESCNGQDAKAQIERLRPDLVFLDVEMPGCSGLEVGSTTTFHPFVIFVTAFPQYALESFKSLTVDYLVKPVEGPRLNQALIKFRQLFSRKQVLPSASASLHSAKPQLDTIRVTVGSEMKLVPVKSILCFEADNKYTIIHLQSNKYITALSLNALEEILPQNFIRTHRKHIVNFSYVESLKKCGDRKLKIKTKEPFPLELIVSRGYVDRITGFSTIL